MSNNTALLKEVLARFEANDPLAALEKLIHFYKMDSSVFIIAQIAESLPANKKKLSLVDVLNFLAQMGYSCIIQEINTPEITENLIPCILFDKKTEFIQVITEKTEKKTSGLVFFFKKSSVKTTKDKKEELSFVERGWFIDMLFRFQNICMKIFKLSAILSITNLFTPLFIIILYSQMSDSSNWYHLYALGLGGLLMIWIDRLIRTKRGQYLVWFIGRLDSITNISIFSKLIRLPTYSIENASIEAQISRLKSFESVREFFTSPLFIHLLELPFIVSACILLIVIGGTLVIVPIIVFFIYLAMLFLFKPHLKTMMFHSSKSKSNLQMTHMETFEKKKSIILSGMKTVWIEKLKDLSAKSSLDYLKTMFQQTILETSAYGISMLANLATIYWGVQKIWDGSLNGGSLFACLILTNRILAPLQAACGSAQKAEQLYRSIQQIDNLMSIETEREMSPALAKAYRLKGHITLSKIGFRYNKESDPALVGFSLDIPPGKFISICGENGTGKSTLIKLLLGLYRPQIGSIDLDGRDIRQIDPVEIRKKFAYLPQFPHFFYGSVLDNLLISNPLATQNEVIESLKFSGIFEEITRLPRGWNTLLSRNTLNFSSDLPYCLSIARGYLKKSPVWLIDEPPNFFLRSENGLLFLEHLLSWKTQKTILFVSNEEAVIQASDQNVMFFSGGRSQVSPPNVILQQLRRSL